MTKRRKKGAGRKRKPGMIRTPGGRISRSNASKEQRKAAQEAEQLETERQAMATVIEARMRHTGLSEEQAKQPMAGSVLGLLHFDRRLSDREYEAGKRYGEAMMRYYSLTGIPHPCPRAQNFYTIRGHDGEESQSKADAARAATNHIMELEGILLRAGEHGRMVKTKVHEVCIMDLREARSWTPYTIGYVKCGLSALADHYGLDKRQSRAA